MNSITLEYAVVTDPDAFVGFKYYVKAGQAFNADDFADAYKLNRPDLDPGSVLATREAAAKLQPGEWLTVSHSVVA
ncbi:MULTISPECIES: hypothetical protein [unclassified Janthinobacterium]|uniref:hypothetical protein n=1 Tax=unclassified Janthinobacterium TaxID=2610881 RepID=UPI00160E84AB|nr:MULTISPECIES: hypothetical protein [unclassified Janthinobacterium]MBB5368587.1 hypothetical protein [Janthinobacterium sp. K2C7]MBB5381877.1 hypothetical protein [Janthinobacterium sp. K2Li3]MBB5386969.1 hypothetical protein [Janthinobacterium sp. K2E3]